ncbi:MAG TPA: hypothetical protein VHR47_06955 [Bacillota bacterium]|nr:hypothetical protein [Bacillota bacterium]
MRNIITDERYKSERFGLEQYFTNAYLLPEETEYSVSPSGGCALTVFRYCHQEGNGLLFLSKGVLRFDDDMLIEVKRDADYFQYAWLQHRTGEYLICGEDSQGYSIVDLKSRAIHHFVPEEAYLRGGFSWIKPYASKDGDILAVEGCYLGQPCQVVFYDISKPLSLPYREILRLTEYGEIIGWKDQRNFEYIDEETGEVRMVRF